MTNSRLIVSIGTTLLAAVALFGLSCDRATVPPSSPRPATTSRADRVLGVEEFMEHVDDHHGPVTVEGVVSGVSSDERRVGLIDLAEFEDCGVVTCAAHTLPVRWPGALPAVKDQVRIQGTVETTNGKLLFVASSAEKIERPGEQR